MASARVKASIKVMLFMVVFPYVVTYLERLQRTVEAPAETRAGAPSISLPRTGNSRRSTAAAASLT